MLRKQFGMFLEFLFALTANKTNFKLAGEKIENYIHALNRTDFIAIVQEIGTIPEIIEASSTEEKLYSKASDIILARCFTELGIRAKSISERGNSADIIAECIKAYSKEQAIVELIQSRKLNEKISAILSYKKSL
ncbi:MAG: HindIII family type II restriction endonuclease [Angelakisella sp.]